jgi:hypothetical protein
LQFIQYFISKLIFKFLELGLGLKTFFLLETESPIFIHFNLTEEETNRLKQALPKGFSLCPIRMTESQIEPRYAISYNAYRILYPKAELKDVVKARLEINTYVQDSFGRKGILVFSGSPIVSKETGSNPLGKICDFAERLVIWIYGCGKLRPMKYQLSEKDLHFQFSDQDHQIDISLALPSTTSDEPLSKEYWQHNDISFFNQGRTEDFVFVNSRFYETKFRKVSESELSKIKISGPLFKNRSPDALFYSHQKIPYLVNALNWKIHRNEEL